MREVGRALFIDTQIFDINRLRGMETDFGIILYQKYDKQQKHCISAGGYGRFGSDRYRQNT